VLGEERLEDLAEDRLVVRDRAVEVEDDGSDDNARTLPMEIAAFDAV
jgi:hypothetical protein